jgi:tetratricopeptide (TPR) repeat protein
MIDMRIAVAVFASLLLLGANAPAQELGREQAVRELSHPDAQSRRAAIDRLGEVGAMADVTALIASLRDPDASARDQAEHAIWRIWSRSGDRDVDALYATGIRQMESGELAAAIATFTGIIERMPQFAEGWNKRATLYFLVGDLHKSLADCDEVVKRNPQHFGALAGYAQIYARLEYYERALEFARRALAINPNLESLRQGIPILERTIEQRRKRTI